MIGMLRFYWTKMVYACKILVDVIWNGDIESFLIMVPFKLNSTEIFTIPINIDAVVFLNVFIRYSVLRFQTVLDPKLSTTIFNIVGHVR